MAIRRSQKSRNSRKHRRGLGSLPLRRGERGLRLESLEERRLLALGPQLMGVLPNGGSLLQEGDIRQVAPQELLFRFDENQTLDPATFQAAFQVVRAGGDGVFGDPSDGVGDDIVVTPGYIGLGELSSQVVLRFKERLVDDHYRVTVKGTGAGALRNTDGLALNDLTNDGVDNGADFRLQFELDLGPQIVAVVPQPITRNADGTLSQARNQIVVYFNDDDLFVENDAQGQPTVRSAENPAFYQLFFTRDTVSNLDDSYFQPTRVQYDAATDRAVLTFAQNLDQLAGAGTYRLRIGTDEARPPAPVRVPVAGEPGSSFAGAYDLSSAFHTDQAHSVILSGDIVSNYFPLNWPGAVDEPGSRSIPVQSPYLTGPDPLSGGIERVYYNFQTFYGYDPEGNALRNQITESQKQRAREIFELYGHYLGIDFVESPALGLTIVTGDMRALQADIDTVGVTGLASADMAIINGNVDWSDRYGDNWFRTAMHEIGHLLGLYHTNELPPITVQNDEPILAFDNVMEPDFPGQYDIMHGQYLHRPENKDIDLYRFELQTSGLFTAETFAERLSPASLLDSTVTLYKQTLTGIEQIAANDDYFSEDAYISLQLGAGVYFLGVAASGNNDYDPQVEDSGIGGTSQGRYELRLGFRPEASHSITDADNRSGGGTALDGDLDGLPGGVSDFWFRAAAPKGEAAGGQPRTIYVDKSPLVGQGTLASPYGNLTLATANALPGDIIRVVGNGGLDKNLATVGDNYAYEIGLGNLPNNILADGRELVAPKLVTLMIDAGAIFKLKDARIGAGSSTLSKDLSAGAIQVLGTPDLSVIFTSFNDEQVGVDTDPRVTVPAPGDWGGIAIRQDLDRAERRFLYDEHGIFLNYINHGDFRYGGGNVLVDGIQQVINPIHLSEASPTISFNRITRSADAAMSADPNSFQEWNYHSPRYQADAPFTLDYGRVGPDIDLNTLLGNTTNGVMVRVTTPAGGQIKAQTVAARWDDTDIVHVVTQSLIIQGTAGGPTLDQVLPPVDLVTLTRLTGGNLGAGRYNYKLVWVDASGNESLASLPTRTLQVVAGSQIRLAQLPPAPAGFVARRLYRSDSNGTPTGDYRLVAQLNTSSTTYTDVGNPGGNLLDQNAAALQLQRARLDASLVIDPRIVVKLEGSRIEVGMGAQLVAEGHDGHRVIFTSRRDDRYGAGGTFDTDNAGGANGAVPGNWGGIYVSPTATASFDYALFAYGGGVVPVEGSFAGFNPLEIHQARARVTRSIFESNWTGRGGQAPEHRFGRGFNADGTIFIRNAQPVIVDNIFRNNSAAAINANVNALDAQLVRDWGRSTGLLDLATTAGDNQGPLIRLNKLENNGINGMIVRGETLTTQSVWDDADIVHVVLSTIYASDYHIAGGLRLESQPTESLIVKLFGSRAGFTATGRPLDIEDRIGGIIQVVGQPGAPVVFTSLRDDTVGAGFRPSDRQPQTDTNNDAHATAPAPGDWRSIVIDQFAHDRNVEVILEAEPAEAQAPGANADIGGAQPIGRLASSEKNGDENLRLGFEIHGFLNAPNDRDVYAFLARAGTEVWIDVDRTRHALDTVVELIGSDGQLIARSDDSYDESRRAAALVVPDPTTQANVLQKSPFQVGRDAYTTNPRDAGMRVVLPGVVGSELTPYYVRVRSSSDNLDDLDAGLSTGRYQVQIRLRETDEVPGSTVRFADIRYATNGIEVYGQPIHSPLLGEAAEADTAANDAVTGAQALGNILNTDRAALSIAGELTSATDVDFYQFQIQWDSIQRTMNPTLYLSTIFDLDYADQLGRADASLYVFDSNFKLILSSNGVRGRDNSNIAEDQPRPLHGADMTDLSRGSAGTLDPFIGTQSLLEGTYYLAVTNSSRMPQELAQFVQADPANPFVRFEPINSIARIVEDRIDSLGGSNVAQAPQVPLFLDPATSVVPFSLGDVTLFVSTQPGIPARDPFVAKVQTVDPRTGQLETTLGNLVTGDSRYPFIGDIAMRYDGRLFSFSQSYFGQGMTDELVGNFLQIDTGTAAVTNLGDDNIQTYQPNDDGTGSVRMTSPTTGAQDGIGVYFNAITFVGNEKFDLYAVGERQVKGFVQLEDNILYRFNTQTGVADSILSPGADRTDDTPLYAGAGTQIVERGQIETLKGARITTVAATDPLQPFDPQHSIQDGTQYRITSSTKSATFEFDTGPEVSVQIDPASDRIIRDGDFMILDGDFFQFDTGSTFVVPAGGGAAIPDGLSFTIYDLQHTAWRFEFDDDGVVAPGSRPIVYNVTYTQDQVRDAVAGTINLWLAVPATKIGSNLISLRGDTRVDLDGRVQVDTTGSVLSTLTQSPAPHLRQETLLIPSGGWSDGDTFSISDGKKTVLFEFEDMDNPTGLVNPGAYAINFDGGTGAGAIALQVGQGLIAGDVRLLAELTAKVPQSGLLGLRLHTALELSGELGDAPIISVQDGTRFSDGEIFTVETVDGIVRFEVDLGGGVAAGNVAFPVSAADTPVMIAERMAGYIRAFTVAEARAVYESAADGMAYVVVNGQQIPLGRTGPGPHRLLTEASAALSTVALFDYGPAPSSFADLDGLLAGFEEIMIPAQFQTQLAQELNIRRPITGATNGVGTAIVITSNGHQLRSGQSVIIRDVNGDLAQDIPGQVYANGLFTVTVVNANAFQLDGTQSRNFAGDPQFDYAGGGYFINYEASSSGERTNFLGGNQGRFAGVPILVDQGTRGGVTSGTVRVPLRARDTAGQVAQVMQQLIDRELYPYVTVAAVGNAVNVLSGGIGFVRSPLTQSVSGPVGGKVTGIAVLGGSLYAVDDRGVLYKVDNYQGGGLTTTVIKDFGNVRWAGLSVGPQQVEGGLYSDLLFGISDSGELFAFNTRGELQPIFVDGRTSVRTGVTGQVTGLAFSNLDKNLWHVSTNRGADLGHGTQASTDASRDPTQGKRGNQSFYFGFQNRDANDWGGLDPTNRNNYDFPGGAHGSLESNTFSLQGYSAGDDPVLYFNYYLETEGAVYDPNMDPTMPMRDAFRVFISADNGEWQLLATNNSWRSNDVLDEYELGEGAVPQQNQQDGRRGVQELFDNTGTWRQARIQLAPWAGLDNLKLRFDFSTAASMDVGGTGGIDIRGVAGEKIRDGQMLVVDSNVNFEFDFGHVLVAPTGAQIVDGARLNIGGVIYEFDSGDGISGNVPLRFSPSDTAEAIAQTIANALPVAVYRRDNRLNLPAADLFIDVLSSGVIYEGRPGVGSGHVPVIVNLAMTPEEVAAVVRQALEDRFAGGDFGPGGDGFQSIPMFREVVRLVGHWVSDPGPLGLNSSLPGDTFGAFNASGPPNLPDLPGRYDGALRGMANDFEGVYIDDIIIGFAERGELVTGAVGNASFVASPLVPDNAQLRGMYQVHIRRGPEYGLPDNALPVTFNILRSFDTNDRLAQAVSLVAPSAAALCDGQTFQISDGLHTVVFEFEDMNVANGVTPGHLMIQFNAQMPDLAGGFTAEPDYVMAQRIRDAINSSDAQAVLQVVAALDDGEVTTPTPPPRPGANQPLLASPSTSNVINLLGNATGDVYPTFDFGTLAAIVYGYGEKTMVGDGNLFRDQGQMLIHSNIIRDALEFGVVADAGQRTRSDLVPSAGTLPHAGPPANLRVRNAERLATGVVIMNNIVANSGAGGIRFSGDPTTTGQLGAVPFGRIANNTIHGNGSGVGIQVADNASPTLLNNVLSGVPVGVSIDATSSTTQLGGQLFQDVATPSNTGVLGAFPILLGAADPLFVDPANYNFLPAAGSKAIDSSIDSLEDRQNLFFVKDPLGISKSPILAPDRDALGQLRGDDPSVSTPAGQGQNVFKDRGAVDRIDFVGPLALLVHPQDNDALGIDTNPRDTMVNITETLTSFRIQLVDPAPGGGAGTGPDDNSVVPDSVTLVRDGRTMIRGVDYSFAYDATSNTIVLSPIAGVWERDRIYEVDLANAARGMASFALTTPADEMLLTVVDTSSPAKTVKFEYDTGYLLLVPNNGGAGLADGETFALAQGAVSKVFELDSNNAVAAGHVRVPFTAASTQTQIADAIVAAISGSGLPLVPRNVGQGRVHIGGNADTTLDTAATAISQTGKPGTVDLAAVAIAIVPGRGEQVAQATAAAINLAVTQGKLVGVKADAFGSNLLITGAASISGVEVTNVSPIRDMAGNLLRPNRADGTTRFTIMTGTGIDFGDAPAPYPTLRENNGAGHRILPSFYLGQFVDAELDGQPSALANADLSDDGVTFPASLVSGQNATIQVVASAAGRLDAWLDANGDGDWNDAGEKIFNNLPLVAGTNSLTFPVNATAVGRPTFMRFRFSSSGGLSPTGMADDGEVEDYAVTIQPNPFQNYRHPRDVNADGFVSAIDALLIINMLNRHPDWKSPTRLADTGLVPPPYVDVDGDGELAPRDALLVINFLNGRPEGEPDGEADSFDRFDRRTALLDDVLEDLAGANRDAPIAAAARDGYFAGWGE